VGRGRGRGKKKSLHIQLALGKPIVVIFGVPISKCTTIAVMSRLY
jgi:hypothetical protein